MDRDKAHMFRVGQNVDVWHGINDYLHVQEQISDAEVLGLESDSKIMNALELLGRCLVYLRAARRHNLPCDMAFEMLRSSDLVRVSSFRPLLVFVCVCLFVCAISVPFAT